MNRNINFILEILILRCHQIHIKVNVLGLRNREGRMDLYIWELSYKDNM